MMWLSCRSLVVALVLTFTPLAVLAQAEEALRLKVESALRFDSNLFRLPAVANLDTLIGRSSAAEIIDSKSLSLNFSTTLSLQKFELAVNIGQNRYRNFSYLSYSAHNYNLAWHWALTPLLHGTLGSQRQETINNFADYQGIGLQNLRSNSNHRLDLVYALDGLWSVAAGLSQSTQANQHTLTAEGDYQERAALLGLRYSPGSGSSVAYTLRNSNGTYLNRVASPSEFYDTGFQQLDSELRLRWISSGKSTAEIYTSQISRSHPNYSQRDYNGRNAGVNFNWSLSGKSALAANWARDISSYQTSISNYSQADRFSVGPVWQVSPRAVLRARYEVTQIDYLGAPFGTPAVTRSETNSWTSLSFDWQPYHYLTISTSIENASRRSSLAGFDYESKMTTVSAQFSY